MRFIYSTHFPQLKAKSMRLTRYKGQWVMMLYNNQAGIHTHVCTVNIAKNYFSMTEGKQELC